MEFFEVFILGEGLTKIICYNYNGCDIVEYSNFIQTKTELHTHLMGMLSSKEFLKLLVKYTEYIYWPINKTEDENSKYIDSIYLLDNEDAIKAISIPFGERRPYGEGLTDLYRNRSELLAFAIKIFASKNNINEDRAQQIVYNDYFNRSLNELIESGIQYTEISFANEDIIKCFEQNDETKGKLKYTFLLCTQRINKIGPSMQEKIKRAYEKGIAIGFDFMGMETPLDEDELKETGRKSYYRKLDSVLEVLVNYPDSVLRIHSGESFGTEENSEKIFRIIDKIKLNKGYKDFPPPELRIGHGIHYLKSDYYYDFLRKNNVIIEINAVSNIALSNINNIDELPYIDYLEHDIPIVLSTDGHGAYSTSVFIEDKISYYSYLKSRIPEAYTLLTKWEHNYMEKKVSR